jgi:hypothetical protein
MKPLDSPEYERGYNNGYRAGRNYRAVKYRRQGWRCLTCDRLGLVLFHSEDTKEKQEWRLAQSHAARFPGRSQKCAGMNLVLLSDTEYERASMGTPRGQEAKRATSRR